MREVNIEVYDDKTIKVSNNGNLGDKFDNNVSQITFDFSGCNLKNKLGYRYFLYKHEDDKDYKHMTISVNVDYYSPIPMIHLFTDRAGEWECLIVLSNEELTFEKWENDVYDWVSNQFSLYIQDNFLVDYKNLNVKENKEAI